MRQLTFDNAEGVRKYSGGRPKSRDSGVPHLKREAFERLTVAHVTDHLIDGMPQLRKADVYEILWEAFGEGKERAGRLEGGEFRLVHYSIQNNHLHLLVEAGDRESLSRGMQGLKVRLTKGLNKLWGHAGTIWADRYHEHLLKTPREVWNALRYVFDNARKHGRRLRANRPDPFSSGLWFEGWRNYVHDGWFSEEGPVARARSWLMRVGWRRHGLLTLLN